jgi:hypothetical protein
MDLTKEQVLQMIAEKEKDLADFIVWAEREVSHRRGGIEALKALLVEGEEDGGKEDE